MFDSVRRSMLIFSRLLQNRRKYVSHLSAVGISVDIYADEHKTVRAAAQSEAPILVDLDSSEWALNDWLESLLAENVPMQAVFFTDAEQSDMIENCDNAARVPDSNVTYYCTNEDAVFHNAGYELLRILELLNAVV